MYDNRPMIQNTTALKTRDVLWNPTPKAAGETLSLRHGVRRVLESGAQVGCEYIFTASHMNTTVAVLIKQALVNTLIEMDYG